MKTRSFYLAALTLFAIGSMQSQTNFEPGTILLDLSKATTSLTFDDVNGMWSDTFNDDATEIESQVFSIVHGSYFDWNYWWGFTASNSVDNAFQSNTLLYQYSNMAKGGILLNENGSIQLNDYGAPVTGKEMPYLVGYPKSQITFNTGKKYEMVGCYVNLNTYTFYTLLYGDGFARAFTQGDDLKLIIHGVDSDENEKTVEVSLASFKNGFLTASTGWTYVDLSPLGIVDEIYFTMTSTDSGQYGMNTPGYFCLDKLAVKESVQSNLSTLNNKINEVKISYDRETKTINFDNEVFAIVYEQTGKALITSEKNRSINVESLSPGIYIVKSGKSHLKFAR